MMFAHSFDWENWGGQEEVRVWPGSVIPVLISVVFPLPAGSETPVFKYCKGQLMGPMVLKGNVVEAICIYGLQRVCRVLWLRSENVRGRSLDRPIRNVVKVLY